MLKHTIASDDFRDKNLAQKGFTLIELLVVILILGILAAVVVIAVSNLTDSAQENSCKTEKRQILTAVEAYRALINNGTYQPTIAQIEAADLLQDPIDASVWGAITYSGNRANIAADAGGKCDGYGL